MWTAKISHEQNKCTLTQHTWQYSSLRKSSNILSDIGPIKYYKDSENDVFYAFDIKWRKTRVLCLCLLLLVEKEKNAEPKTSCSSLHIFLTFLLSFSQLCSVLVLRKKIRSALFVCPFNLHKYTLRPEQNNIIKYKMNCVLTCQPDRNVCIAFRMGNQTQMKEETISFLNVYSFGLELRVKWRRRRRRQQRR